jgi:hypothetical protein
VGKGAPGTVHLGNKHYMAGRGRSHSLIGLHVIDGDRKGKDAPGTGQAGITPFMAGRARSHLTCGLHRPFGDRLGDRNAPGMGRAGITPFLAGRARSQPRLGLHLAHGDRNHVHASKIRSTSPVISIRSTTAPPIFVLSDGANYLRSKIFRQDERGDDDRKWVIIAQKPKTTRVGKCWRIKHKQRSNGYSLHHDFYFKAI